MCHLLQHKYIITQQETHMEWSLDWGQGSLLPAQAQTPALWLFPAEDFASLLLSTDVEMNKAWNFRSFLCLRALAGFHSDSWMSIFMKLKGFYDCCNSAKWGWNQPARSYGMVSASDTQPLEKIHQKLHSQIFFFFMDVRPVVAKQLSVWNAAPGEIPCEISRGRISPNNQLMLRFTTNSPSFSALLIFLSDMSALSLEHSQILSGQNFIPCWGKQGVKSVELPQGKFGSQKRRIHSLALYYWETW